MMRRLLAAATLATIGLSVTVPLASAHTDPKEHDLRWGNGTGPTTANDGGQVWSNDEVVGAYANFIDGIRSWDVVVRPVNGGPVSTCHEDLAQENGKYPTEIYISCPWDTTRAAEHTLPGATAGANARDPRYSRTWQTRDLGPAPNGRYQVEVTVTNGGQEFGCGILFAECQTRPVEPHPLYQPNTDPPRWREVFVVNGIGTPVDVASGFDQPSNRISVTWVPVPEPDASYIVQEKIGDGKWSSGVGVGGNRYERTLDQPGKYQYRVAAVRPAPTRDDGGATKRSDFTAGPAVDVANITPPSTAGASNGPGGAPDGGDPGVFIPTDPTPTTAGGPSGNRGKRPTSARSGPVKGARPSGSSARATGSTADPGEAEGEGPDEGYSPVLPYDDPGEEDPVFDEGDPEDDETQTLAGSVVPKPRDTRQLLIFMAGALTLFVFAMQLTVLLRRSRPVMASAGQQHYHDDFDDWLGF